MQAVLIAVHLLIVIALVASVLLQRSEGGALGAGGGGGFMTGRGQANALTRTTAILAALFFATSIALTLMANFGRAPKSIFSAPAATSAPAAGAKLPANVLPLPSTKGTALDALKQYEQQRGQAAPATPAAPQPTPAAPAAPAPAKN